MKVISILVFALAMLAAQTVDWGAKGKALKQAGDAAGALEAFRKAEALHPKSASLQDEIGFLLAVLGRQDEAISQFERAIQLDPTYAAAHFHLGVAAWLKHDPDRALAGLREAVKLDPKN